MSFRFASTRLGAWVPSARPGWLGGDPDTGVDVAVGGHAVTGGVVERHGVMATSMVRSRRWLMVVLMSVVAVPVVPFVGSSVSARPPSPSLVLPRPAQSADWLEWLNWFRQSAGLQPVVADESLRAAAMAHLNYMTINNNCSHSEDPSKPGYSAAGDAIGRAAAMYCGDKGDPGWDIRNWAMAPLHAQVVFDPDMTNMLYVANGQRTLLVGVGRRHWSLRPQSGRPFGLWPADGMTLPRDMWDQTTGEVPDPYSFGNCATPDATPDNFFNAPFYAMLPEAPVAGVSVSLRRPDGSTVSSANPGDLCFLTDRDTASMNGAGHWWVIGMYRNERQHGLWTATVSQPGKPDVSWSWTNSPADLDGLCPTTRQGCPGYGGGPIPPTPVASTTATPVGLSLPAGSGAKFAPTNPYRLADTRSGSRIAAGATRSFPVPGGGSAVTLNVTATDAQAAGYLTVFPCGSPQPGTSNVNYTTSGATPNQVTVGVGSSSSVCVFSSASTHVILDVAGSWSTSGTATTVPMAPRRLWDTRGQGGPLSAGSTLRVTVPGSGPAVSLNVTATDVTQTGYVTAWPCDSSQPTVSNLNPAPGVTKPNHVTVAVGASRQVCLFTSGRTNLIVDQTGDWAASGSGSLASLSSPARTMDTRTMGNRAKLLASTPLKVLDQQSGVVFANLTTTDSTSGFAVAYPCNAGVPSTSTVNFTSAGVTSNAVQVDASQGGVCVWSSAAAHVIFDVSAGQR